MALANIFGCEPPSGKMTRGSRSRSRSLTPEENERVCDAVRGLLDEYDSQGELSAAILLPEGKAVSQQSVSNALANKTVGITFARSVAMRMGISLEELISGNPKRPACARLSPRH